MLASWTGRLTSLVILLIVAAGVLLAVWWFFIRSDEELADSPLQITTDGTATPAADETPDATAADEPTEGQDGETAEETEEPTEGEGNASAGEGVEHWVIVSESDAVDGQTEAAYFADEELASLGVPSTAKGTTFLVDGEFFLTVDGLDPENTSSFTADLTMLESDESRRDNRVQQTLDTGTYPTTTFTATALIGMPNPFPEGEEVTIQLTGTLDLHGVQREVTWDVVATRSGSILTALATVNVLYEDFDITPPNIGGFVSVEDDVTLQVQLIAELQP